MSIAAKPTKTDARFLRWRDAIVAQYTPMVWRLARQCWNEGPGKNIGSVEDCFQIGIIALMRAANNFEPTMGCKFITYGYRCVQLVLRRAAFLKPRLPVIYVDNRELEEMIAGQRWTVDAELDRDALLRCLCASQRHVIEAYFFEGRKLDEIAAERGVSRQRVQQIKERALEKLRKALSREVCA